MHFRKSSFSGGNGDCVEVATDGEAVFVRDSKVPDGGTLALTGGAWRSLLDGVKAGELDSLS